MYLLSGALASESGGVWSRFTVPEHQGQVTRTGETIYRNLEGKQGSASPRRSLRDYVPSVIALHSWLTPTKSSFPSYRRLGLGAVDISTGYGTLPSCWTCPSPLHSSHTSRTIALLSTVRLHYSFNPSVLYPRPQRCTILFPFLYDTSRSLSFFRLVATLLLGFPAIFPRPSAKCSSRPQAQQPSIMQARRKTVRLPPCFYMQQREELAEQGRTPPRPADNTKKSLASVVMKVNK